MSLAAEVQYPLNRYAAVVAKPAAMLAIVALTFLALIVFGFSADGHGIYSADHETWRDVVSAMMWPALGLGLVSTWLFALVGGQRAGAANDALRRAAVIAVLALALAQIPQFNLLFGFMISGVVGAIVFAGRHSWRMLLFASAPLLFLVLAVATYALLAPPNAGAAI